MFVHRVGDHVVYLQACRYPVHCTGVHENKLQYLQYVAALHSLQVNCQLPGSTEDLEHPPGSHYEPEVTDHNQSKQEPTTINARVYQGLFKVIQGLTNGHI